MNTIIRECFVVVIPSKDYIKQLAVELANDVDAGYVPSDLLLGVRPLKKSVKLIHKVNKKLKKPKCSKRLALTKRKYIKKPNITKKKGKRKA